jgi:hypothetical protein
MKNRVSAELELAPLAGLEPATQGLGIPCSVHTELQGYLATNNLAIERFFFNLYFGIGLSGKQILQPFNETPKPVQN